MTSAFLLTSHWYDSEDSTRLVFWWHSQQGTVRQQIKQLSVCFIEQSDQARAEHIAQTLTWPIIIKTLPMKHFNQQNVSACYMPQGLIYRWQNVLKQEGIPVREADVRPTERYLMERFIYAEAQLHGELEAQNDGAYLELLNGRLHAAKESVWQPDFRVVSLDIETSFPRLGEPDRLFSIGLYAQDMQRVLMLGVDNNTTKISYYPDEPSLLKALLDWLNHYDPDIIIGWNIVNFDFAFLYKKYQEHGIAFNLGRDGSALHLREISRQAGQHYLSIAGRVVLDGISQLRNAAYQFESFALNAVAEELLGDNKLLQGDDRGDDIEYLFEHNKPQLAAYNLKDCELVWRIFSKTKLLEFAVERSRMTGLSLDKVGGSVAAFENLYLPRLHRAGYIAPNLGEGWFTQDSPGGYVLDSKPGLFEHVLVLDFKSLYPSIIRTFCIDPVGLVEGLHHSKDNEVVEGFFGARFHRQHHILPKLIAELGVKREAAKRNANQSLNQAIKIIMASCYGVLGSYGCRFGDNRLSASITLRGQQIIQQSCEWVHAQGFKVIYGDTDSIFVWLNQSLADDEVEAIGKRLMQGLNQWWTHQCAKQYGLTSYLEIEYETHYRKFFMPAIRGEESGSKKRYAGLVLDKAQQPQMIFKGLEAVRSDWTPLARNFQRELYRRVFAVEPYQQWLADEIKALFAGKKDHELIYHKRLRQPLNAYQKNIPPHAQAAAKLERWRLHQGMPARFARSGGHIYYYQSHDGPEPLVDDNKERLLANVDYYHYLNKQLRPIAEAIFQFTGDDFEHLAGLQLSLF